MQSINPPILLPFPWNKRTEDREPRHGPQEHYVFIPGRQNQMNRHTQANGYPGGFAETPPQIKYYIKYKGAAVPPLQVAHIPHQTQKLGEHARAARGIIQTLTRRGKKGKKSVCKRVGSSVCRWSHTTWFSHQQGEHSLRVSFSLSQSEVYTAERKHISPNLSDHFCRKCGLLVFFLFF